MEEEDSGPYEEFRICFCGQTRSGSVEGSVEWYRIDVSVKEACLSEKTESSTRKLNPFSVSNRLSSYAALGGLIYSLGGRFRSLGGGDTLLKDVWLLDFTCREDLKPGLKPDSGEEHGGEDWKPDSDKTQAQSQAHKTESEKNLDEQVDALGRFFPPVLEEEKLKLVPGRKPGSGKAPDKAQAQSPSAVMEPKLEPGLKPDSGKAQAQAQAQEEADWKSFWALNRAFSIFDSEYDMAQFASMRKGEEVGENTAADVLTGRKPGSGNSQSGEYWKPDSDKASPTPLTAPSVEDWKPGLPMNFARYNPHTMVVDHKLYVLGGFLPNQNQAVGWIEVFDPEEKRWESLPSPPDQFQIHSSIMISGLLNSKKEIIIARDDLDPLSFYSYEIKNRSWKALLTPESALGVLPPNAGRAVTVGNTLYWISTEEDNHECTIRAYDLDTSMWFEDHLNTATIFGRREYFSSIYSRGPGFLHLVDQKFCLLLQSSFTKKDSQSSIEYLYCVILDISPIDEREHEDWGKFELTTVSVQKYSMDHYIDFLDCMLLDRVSGVKSVDRGGQSTGTVISFQEIEEFIPWSIRRK